MRIQVQPWQTLAIRGAWVRFLVVAAGIALVLLTIGVMLWPEISAFEVEAFRLPQKEASFGFRGARVSLVDPSSGRRFKAYAITRVDPGGALAQAGVVAGDLPDWSWGFYLALQDSAAGRQGQFYVRSTPDWSRLENRRLIKLGAPERRVR